MGSSSKKDYPTITKHPPCRLGPELAIPEIRDHSPTARVSLRSADLIDTKHDCQLAPFAMLQFSDFSSVTSTRGHNRGRPLAL